MDHQHVDAKELTSWVRRPTAVLIRAAETARGGDTALSDQPLAIRLAQALETGGTRQRVLLRQVGDASLFLSGFFPIGSSGRSSTSTTTRASAASHMGRWDSVVTRRSRPFSRNSRNNFSHSSTYSVK